MKVLPANRTLYDTGNFLNIRVTDEERQLLLQAVRAETKQSLSATLGPKDFAACEKIDGGWMQQMSASRR